MDHMTAKVSCFARAYHHKHNETHIFDDNAAERLLGEDYAQIAKNMTEGLPFFFPDFEEAQHSAEQFPPEDRKARS